MRGRERERQTERERNDYEWPINHLMKEKRWLIFLGRSISGNKIDFNRRKVCLLNPLIVRNEPASAF